MKASVPPSALRPPVSLGTGVGADVEQGATGPLLAPCQQMGNKTSLPSADMKLSRSLNTMSSKVASQQFLHWHIWQRGQRKGFSSSLFGALREVPWHSDHAGMSLWGISFPVKRKSNISNRGPKNEDRGRRWCLCWGSLIALVMSQELQSPSLGFVGPCCACTHSASIICTLQQMNLLSSVSAGLFWGLRPSSLSL